MGEVSNYLQPDHFDNDKQNMVRRFFCSCLYAFCLPYPCFVPLVEIRDMIKASRFKELLVVLMAIFTFRLVLATTDIVQNHFLQL